MKESKFQGAREQERTPESEALLAKIEELKNVNAALARENAELKRLATKDPLTELNNRRGLEEFWKGIVEQAPESGEKRKGERMKANAVLLLDLDNFKLYNDLYGHVAADKILKESAKFFEKNVRKGDVIARLGGDEFVVIFRNTTSWDILDKLYDKEAGVARLGFETEIINENSGKKERVRVAFTGGIADVAYGDTLDSALHRADQALYASKEAGRDCITRYAEQER